MDTTSRLLPWPLGPAFLNSKFAGVARATAAYVNGREPRIGVLLGVLAKELALVESQAVIRRDGWSPN